MKKIIAILIGLCMINMVYAIDPIEVDCGDGWIGDICTDSELDEEFGEITDYINDNEAAWLKDEIGGGGGRSIGGISNILWGVSTGFDTYNFFAAWVIEQINDAEERVNKRIDRIEAIQILNINGEPLTEESIMLQAVMLQSKRTGKDVMVEDWHCNGKCYKLTALE